MHCAERPDADALHGGSDVLAAFVVAGPAVHVQANRISRIVRLGDRRPYRDYPD
jgi:hypothetical protein